MQTAIQFPKPPRPGVWEPKITGLYRTFTPHQLAMAWWCYREKHITLRQLRIFFAANEMHEKRQWTKGGKGGKRPLYELQEIRRLIGSADTKTALTALSADVKRLGRLGLVEIAAHRITFAASIEQINVEDMASFWTMFGLIENNRRTVPMPRRTCRALAAGFRPAVMATMIGLMLRGLYWHKREGQYRVDGRTKRSWVAQVFGVSERAITDARATLIELGWLKPLECQQWLLNRYGAWDQINVHAFGPRQAVAASGGTGQSASPRPDNTGQSASPDLNSSALSTRDLNTRRPAPMRAEPTVISIETYSGSRKKTTRRKTGILGDPTLRNVTEADLGDTARLLELHRQAVEAGLPVRGEAGRLDFLALADRARSAGHNPPKLFAWLLKHRRFDFIAIANEEAAAARLRELNYGKRETGRGVGGGACSKPLTRLSEYTDEDRFVIACIRVGQQHRCEPFRIAQKAKQWPRSRWDEAHEAFQDKQRQQWGGDE